MLDRLGIRSRVLLLALLPASLMALVLGSYFNWLQQNELRTQLLQRGKMLAEQLAPLAAPSLANPAQAQELLERIAAQALEQADVRAVAFLAPDRSRLAQELDQAEFRANRLEEVNREVSRRLVTAMETIRAVLDR